MDDFQTNFKGLAPFPEDVPQVPLLRIDLQKVIDNDQGEIDRLWKACIGLGFFYLDLRGCALRNGVANGHSNGHGHQNGHRDVILDGKRFDEDASRLFDVISDLFGLPLNEKQKYDFRAEGSYFGYKAIGLHAVDKHGSRDRNEFYNMSKDDVLGLSDPLPAPDLIKTQYPLVRSYMTNAHSIVHLLLSRINSQLGLADFGSSLPSLHELHSRSGDQVRMIQVDQQPTDAPPSASPVALGAHTDFGSVTLLFNRLGGLQVYAPPGTHDTSGKQDGGWMYVRPLPGHCIVNLGDALVKFSAGILKSATHRIVSPPGEQARFTRTSLVYFARPADEVLLRALKGQGSAAIDKAAAEREEKGEVEEEINAKDWILRRALPKRTGEGFRQAAGTEIAGSRDV